MAKVESFHCVSFYCWMLCSSFVFSVGCCVIEKVALRDAWFYGISRANAFCRGPRPWLIFLRWLKHMPLFFWDQQLWPGHHGFCFNLPLLFSTLSLLLATVAMDVFISFIVYNNNNVVCVFRICNLPSCWKVRSLCSHFTGDKTRFKVIWSTLLSWWVEELELKLRWSHLQNLCPPNPGPL